MCFGSGAKPVGFLAVNVAIARSTFVRDSNLEGIVAVILI